MAPLRLLEARRPGGVTATRAPVANTGQRRRDGPVGRALFALTSGSHLVSSDGNAGARVARDGTLRVLLERSRQSTSVEIDRHPSRILSQPETPATSTYSDDASVT